MIANGTGWWWKPKAGDGASYTDKDYSDAGAKIAYKRKKCFECDILVKSALVSDEDCVYCFTQPVYHFADNNLPVMKREILQKMMDPEDHRPEFREPGKTTAATIPSFAACE